MEKKLIAAIVFFAVLSGTLLLGYGFGKGILPGFSEKEQSMQGENAGSGDGTSGGDSLEPGQTGENRETAGGSGQPAEGTGIPAGAGNTAEDGTEAGAGSTAEIAAAVNSPEMEALEKHLREELEEKRGDWSLYLYRCDTGEEIGINAEEPMISASLIKLFAAGCYLEKVENGEVPDNYQNQLFAMLSASDNGATNTLIDLLGKDRVNEFMERHGYKAGELNRKMLEKNGTENYTSAEDCGQVLRKVYEWAYISPQASQRVMTALLAQIERNRAKIPAGVPDGIYVANKTGELFTTDRDGVNVSVQNDAAVIFAPDHTYILTVMSSVPSGGEAQLHREIAQLSAEVYEAICGGPEQPGEDAEEAGTGETAEEAETAASAETAEETATAEGTAEAGTGRTAEEAETAASVETAEEAATAEEPAETGTGGTAEEEETAEEAAAAEESAEAGTDKTAEER